MLSILSLEGLTTHGGCLAGAEQVCVCERERERERDGREWRGRKGERRGRKGGIKPGTDKGRERER